MSIRVLCVDDERAMLELMKAFLQRDPDLCIECACCAADALEILDKSSFDAIVSDYQMPDMDGIELLKALRGKGSDTPFIIFTGKGREEVAMVALNEGAEFYMQKGGQPSTQFAELANMIKRAADRKTKETALHDLSQKLAAMVDSSPNPIYAMDLDGRLTMWNRAAERVFGWKDREVLGKTSPIIHEEDRDEFLRTMKEMAARGEAFSSVELRRRKKDGTIVDVLLSTAPMSDQKGEVIGFLANAVDLTERRKMELDILRLNQMYALLSSVNTSIVHDSTRKGLLQDVCDDAVDKAGFSACGIGIVDSGEVECAYMDSRGGIDETAKGPPAIMATLARVALEAARDGGFVSERLRERRGDHTATKPIRSVACRPITTLGRETYVLWLCSDDPDFFEEKERMFLNEVAADIAFALTRMDGALA